MKNKKRRYICISFTTLFVGPVKAKSMARRSLIIVKMFYSSFLEWGFFLEISSFIFLSITYLFELFTCYIQPFFVRKYRMFRLDLKISTDDIIGLNLTNECLKR